MSRSCDDPDCYGIVDCARQLRALRKERLLQLERQKEFFPFLGAPVAGCFVAAQAC
jgi:hypothetical protein